MTFNPDEELDFTSKVGNFLLLEKELKNYMQTIHWYESKTVWFNIIVTVLGVVASLQGLSTFDKYAQILGGITVLGNTILRVWFTSAPITTSASNTLQ